MSDITLNKKDRTLLYNIFGTFTIKGFSILVTMLTVPSFITYFDNNMVLGFWYTATSLLNWILLFDFGVGNGLRYYFAKALSESNWTAGKELTSSAYFFLGIIAFLLAIIGIEIINASNLNLFFNVSEVLISPSVLNMAVSIIFLGTIFHFWVKLLSSILYAMQKTALNNSLFLLSNVIILVFLNLPISLSLEHRLILLSCVQVGAINLPFVFATFILFLKKLQQVSPSFGYVKMSAGKKVVGLGGAFFAIQIALLITNSTNEFLISSLYASNAVVDYQVYFKVFSLVVTLFSLVIQPLWSGITSAYVSKEYFWIKNTYKRVLLISFACCLIAIILGFLFPFIIKIWLPENTIQVSFNCVFSFILFDIVNLLVNTSTCIANGVNRLTTQVVFSIIAAFLKFPLAYFFFLHGIGWEGVVLSNAISLLPLMVAQLLFNAKLLKGFCNSVQE